METPRAGTHLPPTREGDTPCCGRAKTEGRPGGEVSLDYEQVTCNGLLRQPGPNPIVRRKAALRGRAEGSLERLLQVRARLNRASSSCISATFRDELLELIDRGKE